MEVTALVDRIKRQGVVANWCRRAFGAEQQASVEHRAIRFLEEAIEAYQAAGANADMAHKLIDYVFSRPAGTLARELGGVGVTVLALAESANIEAEVEECREIRRVLSKPVEHFTKRNAMKDAAGFSATRPSI